MPFSLQCTCQLFDPPESTVLIIRNVNFFAYKLSVATRSLPDQVQTPQPSINTLRFCKCPTAPVVQQHLMVLGLVKLNYVPRGMFGPFC